MLLNFYSAANVYYNITGNPFTPLFPTWGWITLLIVGLIIAPFFAFHKVYTKLDDILSATPNMNIASPPYVDTRPIYSRIKIEGQYSLIGTPYFAHVNFCNEPKVYAVEAAAKDTYAEISFYTNKGELLLGSIYGRWGDTKQPEDPFEPTRELVKVNFEPTGQRRELDIAMKYPEDKDCYAFNNESYSSYDWRISKFLLKGDSFYVKVRLAGIPMIDKIWWFALYNEGRGKGMRIEPTSPPALVEECRQH